MRRFSSTRIGLYASLLLRSVVAAADDSVKLPSISLNAIGMGAFSRTDLSLGMLEARAALSPYLTVTAAPAILSIGGARTERQFRTAAVLMLRSGPVQFDDRNLWAFSDAGTTRYRNRLRMTVPVTLRGQPLRLQILDEVFYEEGGRGWFRNMVGGGVGLDLSRSISVDAYWMRVDENYRERSSMVVVSITARLVAEP